MKILSLFALAGITLLYSCANKGNEANTVNNIPDMNGNPFAKVSTLPFQTADFSKIKSTDFKPAIQAGIMELRGDIDTIVSNKETANFDNTIVALEKSGELLNRVMGVFSLLNGANTDDILQKTSEDMAPELSAVNDAMFLNTKLFERVEYVYNHKGDAMLDPESKRLIDYYYQKFILAGVKLSDKDKDSLKKLNAEDASLSVKFTNQLLAGAKAGALVVDNKQELDGLTEGDIAAAADAAKEAGQDGKWMLPLQNTTQQPMLTFLNNRDTRKKLFDASWTRTEKGDSNDTRPTILRLATIRAERAKLIGFPNYSALVLADQMAKKPENVFNFLNQLIPASVAKAKDEAAEIQETINKSGQNFNLEPWDWNYYSEKVRKAKYDLDESQVKPYFQLDSVLKNGVFYAATQLYGITFKLRPDLPVYNPDVKAYEVFDADGSSMALFYCDYFKRPNKNGGAWMDNIVRQSKLLGTKPVVYNVCNFAKPSNGEPALISFDDVTTMFHEFGHALHGMFASQEFPSLSGTATARDWVEFPSQFNEHWATYPSIFNHYARHYKTGEPMPQTLLDKIEKASKFNQGYMLTELLAAASLDMQWHTLPAGSNVQDVDAFEKQALEKSNVYLPQVPPRYRSSYFLHIWSNGYASGYYAYIWTEMLDDDAYSWFEQNGGLSRKNGQRFRDMILSRGNTEDLNKLFYNFRGRNPDIKPMLLNRGLVQAGK
jgi:peptidyl-dipeptidase Dcp